jgi:hypothetical protein
VTPFDDEPEDAPSEPDRSPPDVADLFGDLETVGLDDEDVEAVDMPIGWLGHPIVS